MITDISVVPMSEFRTVAISVFVNITTETFFHVTGHFDRMVYPLAC
jgi:hypothetical protein